MTPSPSPGARPSPFTISVVDPASPAEASDGKRRAAEILVRSVGADHADDRFEPFERTDDHSVLVLAGDSGRDVAVVTARSSRDRFQLDVVADNRSIVETAGADGENILNSLIISMIDRATAAFDRLSTVPSSAMTLELWGRPRQSWHSELAEELGLQPFRSLYQMRCRLPLDAEPSTVDRTRPIDPPLDTEHVLTVNNRAFSTHPDQSDQQLFDFRAAFTSPSFVPASVRVLDPDPDDSRSADHPLVGFCWTKIHAERPTRPALGEIYVIAVDPSYHGEGHGTGLSAAGLRWLADQGLSTGMLYVESDNDPAVATYRKLGFTVHGTYTAWRRS